MKIITLTAENIKRLIAVEIKPDGNMVQISGKNGQGKTSVLDSIWWALAGAKHIQSAPIRKGATQARIKLDLGEVLVTRTFSREKEGEGFTTKLEVVGNVRGSPQAMLDSLLDSLAFDPLKFARMEPAQQFDALKQFAPGVDFDAIAAANSIDMANRKDINRRAKEARITADKIQVPPNTPRERIDETDLITQLTAAGRHNADIQIRVNCREQAEADVQRLRRDAQAHIDRAAELKRQVADAEALASESETKAAKIETKLANAEPLPESITIDEIQRQIVLARAINQSIALRERKEEQEKVATKLEADAKALTDRMALREQEKLDAIAQTKLPIESLTFGEGVVLLNGVPFDQASDAEQLKASCALAMAGNPQLRVIRVRDGSLLDEESLRLLAAMAEEKDFQVWIETVAPGKTGFVLEDGQLLAATEKDAVQS